MPVVASSIMNGSTGIINLFNQSSQVSSTLKVKIAILLIIKRIQSLFFLIPVNNPIIAKAYSG